MENVGYFAPTEVGEALKLLAEQGDKATVLAGGTDLVPAINYYSLWPDNLIYIGGLGLDYVKEEGGKLLIGGGATWTQIMEDALVAEKAPVLAEAAKQGGSVATRNAGTVGGNLANASPAADLTIILLALEAEVLLQSASGQRVVALKDFFTGPGKSVMNPDELLIEVQVPLPVGSTAFQKLGRRKAMTLSVVNTGVKLSMEGKLCQGACISLGAMAPTPLRCTAAEELITGKELDAALIAQCAAAAVAAGSPIDDQRASAWYRTKAGTALVARALAQAAGIDG
jgi:CO/xanthine dehydrogenase FAD-binding subunit